MLLALILAQVVVPSSSPSSAVLPTVTSWRDGARERPLQLEVSIVALREPDRLTTQALRAAGAVEQTRHGLTQLWKVANAAEVLRAVPAALPVYRDGPRMRVPVGGVIVVPASGTAEALQRRLGRGVVKNGTVSIQCPPREALEFARSLRGPDIDWAQPNWWHDVSAKEAGVRRSRAGDR